MRNKTNGLFTRIIAVSVKIIIHINNASYKKKKKKRVSYGLYMGKKYSWLSIPIPTKNENKSKTIMKACMHVQSYGNKEQ